MRKIVDLSWEDQQPKAKKAEEDEPMGLVILSLLPFAVLFWWIFTQGFINGIF